MKLLVLCRTNSVCSQMAEAYLETLDNRLQVTSAGTKPYPVIHPLAIRVMHEKGFSLLGKQTKKVDHFLGESFDYLITLSQEAREDSYTFPCCIAHRIHIALEEPQLLSARPEVQLLFFRGLRDHLFGFLDDLYQEDIAPRLPVQSKGKQALGFSLVFRRQGGIRLLFKKPTFGNQP